MSSNPTPPNRNAAAHTLTLSSLSITHSVSVRSFFSGGYSFSSFLFWARVERRLLRREEISELIHKFAAGDEKAAGGQCTSMPTAAAVGLPLLLCTGYSATLARRRRLLDDTIDENAELKSLAFWIGDLSLKF